MEKNKVIMNLKYIPQEIEKGRYNYWLEKGVFFADEQSDKKPFTMILPPPNVTGKLHLGHAWDTAIQDTIARYKRIQGYNVLWLPGMDHAGIATQAKVDERLRNETSQSARDIGREAFLEAAFAWKEEYAQTIREQWAKIGLALDYTKERFTLDQGASEAVRMVFIEMYKKGLIYRGNRIINWDPKAQTALSDIEVIHKEVEGKFYHFKYRFEEDTETYLEVATTRPETMFGDVAVAVHPEDTRYQKYIGSYVINPANASRLPIIADEMVEMEFGTGVVKITGAHDPNDFEVCERHPELSKVIVMNLDGTMNAHAGEFEGLDRFDAREQLVARMKKEDNVIRIEDHIHQVGHSERTGVIVEPLLSAQWFIRMEELARRSLNAQKNGEGVTFVPERFEHTFTVWMENIRDWCISRQLWWGHQIPAYYHRETGEIFVGEKAPNTSDWIQDEDVLDTWFSSALWPFSTLGWPNTESQLYKTFYPTQALVTGYDIIFFWVSRMIFQALEFTDTVPFKDVIIHGLIRDAEGRKMSKSLGNGVDPMDVIDTYGSDALRHFLLTNSSPGQDLRFIPEKLEASWNFGNKIWNASRYVLSYVDVEQTYTIDVANLRLEDRFILSRLSETVRSAATFMDKYEFGEYGRVLYNFIWEDFCNWYIEVTKIALQGDDGAIRQNTIATLTHTLSAILRMLHPLMPFITEEIWQYLPQTKETSILEASWPNDTYYDEASIDSFEFLQNIIKSVRTIRLDKGAKNATPLDIYIQTSKSLSGMESYLNRFCNPKQLFVGEQLTYPSEHVSVIIKGALVVIPLEGLVNMKEEMEKLEREEHRLEKEITRAKTMLSNERFLSKAPQAKVEEEERKLVEYTNSLEKVKEQLNHLRQP